jgi:hypothetical protein
MEKYHDNERQSMRVKETRPEGLRRRKSVYHVASPHSIFPLIQFRRRSLYPAMRCRNRGRVYCQEGFLSWYLFWKEMLGISIFSPALIFLWLTNIDADTVPILNTFFGFAIWFTSYHLFNDKNMNIMRIGWGKIGITRLGGPGWETTRAKVWYGTGQFCLKFDLTPCFI